MNGIGEVASAAILLASAAGASLITLGVFSESAQTMWDDARSRVDVMRAQAVEQLDVTGVEWRSGHNLTFIISNYGNAPAGIPLALYTQNGTDVTDYNVAYHRLNGTAWITCDTATPCDLYHDMIPPRDAILVRMSWDAPGTLILVTDTGRFLRVSIE